MATESPLLHDGGHCTLSTLYDARRSSLSGTTLNGPNGSGQFFPVSMSTLNDLQVNLSTGFTPSTFAPIIGILQNTPGPGEICDIGIFGVSKALAGSTFVRGTLLQASSTSAGYVVPYLQGNGPPLGFAYESPSAAGVVFTMALFGFVHGGYST
jgi:hypothetical protein